MMKLVKNLKDIEANAVLLADIIHSYSKDYPAAASLIGKGRAFFPFFYQGKLAFSPSRFIGYKSNSLVSHIAQRSQSDGRITNRQIDSILGLKYIEDDALHKELEAYTRRTGVKLEDRKHRFWPIETAKRQADRTGSAVDDLDDDNLGNDDPDYREAVRTSYKRDPAVRKAVLMRAMGQCEYCGLAPFMTSTGTVYLETHHILALSKQGPDRVSNVIALCANHHREAHFSEGWKALQATFLKVLAKKAAK